MKRKPEKLLFKGKKEPNPEYKGEPEVKEDTQDQINERPLLKARRPARQPKHESKSLSRMPYSKKDHNEIQDYLTKNIGRPCSLKYWKSALANGLNLDHSAESLKSYYRRNLSVDAIKKEKSKDLHKKVIIPSAKAQLTKDLKNIILD